MQQRRASLRSGSFCCQVCCDQPKTLPPVRGRSKLLGHSEGCKALAAGGQSAQCLSCQATLLQAAAPPAPHLDCHRLNSC